MKKQLLEQLVRAQGRSEFVIVLVADIRGFSAFSTVNESPNIAMYIKRFYLQMLNHYFAEANFAKPTGDGLLMTFPYSEDNLKEQSAYVIDAVMRCLREFPRICGNDPMINFPVPQAIGFGLARGTACCLHSGDEVIDYSGHLLNLTSRLMDLARPGGLVIDANFLKSIIPEAHRRLFGQHEVYIRSIAEEVPMKVLALNNSVQIPDLNKTRLRGENWFSQKKIITVLELEKLSDRFIVHLEKIPKEAGKIKVVLSFPKKDLKGYFHFADYKTFEIFTQQHNPTIVFQLDSAKSMILPLKLPKKTALIFDIQFVPKV